MCFFVDYRIRERSFRQAVLKFATFAQNECTLWKGCRQKADFSITVASGNVFKSLPKHVGNSLNLIKFITSIFLTENL